MELSNLTLLKKRMQDVVNSFSIHDERHSTVSKLEEQTNYFNDGIRRIDYILVYSLKSIETLYVDQKINIFLNGLQDKGIETECEYGCLDNDLVFIKLHAPRPVLLHYAEIYDIDLKCQNCNYKPKVKLHLRFMGTEIINPNVDSAVCNRARDTLYKEKPTEITTAERTIIMDNLLKKARYGYDKNQFGITRLLQEHVFLAAYPLHDSKWQWTTEGDLSDRQLLAEYWANGNMWYKQQPLNLIEKYFGTEIAFYFAWLGFYNRMLIPAAIVGFICFFIGIIGMFTEGYNRSDEVCESNIVLCPRCQHKKFCKFTMLKSSCLFTKLTYLFDNRITVCFAIFMSFWAIIFMELWKRQQAILQLRWNVSSREAEMAPRTEFEKKTKYRRVSYITGNLEPYVPKRIQCAHFTITYATIIFMILIVIASIVGIIIYRLAVTYSLNKTNKDQVGKDSGSLIASATSAIISVIFIIIFGAIYEKVARMLTSMENPRTQIEFDNSYIYKRYALAFVNNYAAIIYLAFFKGRFYTYPGDQSRWKALADIKADLCDPSGCIIDLCIQLFIILIVKTIISNINEIFIPKLLILWKKSNYGNKKNATLRQWEQEYMLNCAEKYQFVDEYLEMILQYGFVTFFVAAFPLAPLLALLNNLAETRIDAIKMIRRYQRPVPNMVSGLGAWNGILQAITSIGIVTNAFVIAFTSDFISREIYRYTVNSNLDGYINSTLSAFATGDYQARYVIRNLLPAANVGICYYHGKRYPPDHPDRYQLTLEYWFELSMRFLGALIFEHSLMILTGFVAYAIPDVPYSVKEQLNYQQEQQEQLRKKLLHESYLKNKAHPKINSRQKN